MKQIFSSKTKLTLEFILVSLLLLFAFGFTLYQSLTIKHYHHFSLLAEAFLAGRTNIIGEGDMYLDTVVVNGKYYFTSDPLAGVMMIPFSLIFGHKAPQGYLNFLATMVSAFLLWRILSRVFKVKNLVNRIWLLLIFFFASNMVSIIWSAQPWFLGQNIGIMFVLGALYEWKTRKRLWLMFIIVLLLTLAKKNMAFPIGAYLFTDILFTGEKIGVKLKMLGVITAAGALGAFIIMAYHLQGMDRNTLAHYYEKAHIEQQLVEKIRKYGFFNLYFIPTNFINYLLAGPIIVRENPNDPHSPNLTPYIYPPIQGISFFFLGPVFLALFFLPLGGKKEVLPVIAAVFVWMATYFTYHATGAAQFGARYAAEIVPFLFLLLAAALARNLSWVVKGLAVGSMLLNMQMFLTLTSFYMNP